MSDHRLADIELAVEVQLLVLFWAKTQPMLILTLPDRPVPGGDMINRLPNVDSESFAIL